MERDAAVAAGREVVYWLRKAPLAKSDEPQTTFGVSGSTRSWMFPLDPGQCRCREEQAFPLVGGDAGEARLSGGAPVNREAHGCLKKARYA